jgi:hypothetical protein
MQEPTSICRGQRRDATDGGRTERPSRRDPAPKRADVGALDQLKKNAMTYAAGQGNTDIVVLLIRAASINAVYAHDHGVDGQRATKTETVRRCSRQAPGDER